MAAIGEANDDQVQQEIRAAQTAFRAGKVDDALTLVASLIERYPNRSDVLTAKGVLEAAQNKQEEAFLSFCKALDQDPNLPETLGWAAYVSLNLLRFSEAEQFSRRLTRLAPENARSHYLLASALRGLDRIEEGLLEIDRALALKPDDADSLVTKARLLQAWRMPALAGDLFRKALSLQPNPAAGTELGKLLLRDGRAEEALEVYRRITRYLPAASRPYRSVAEAYTMLHRFDQANEQWNLARRYSSNPDSISQSQALAEIAAGRFHVAEALLRELIDREKDLPVSFAILAKARKFMPEDLQLLHRVEHLIESGEVGPAQAIEAEYSLGKGYDDLKDYENAIRHYDEANRIGFDHYAERQSFNCDQSRSFTDFLIELAQPDKLASSKRDGLPDDWPLFIVGMMRSGTTLTETILGAHSKIEARGEQAFWTERLIEFVYMELDRLHFDRRLALTFAKDYLQFNAKRDPDSRYVSDKNPGNIEIAGILHTLLPNAKFVHLKRHPVDNLLSIWMTPVSAHVRYASNRRNLVFTYRQYLRLVRHLESVLPLDRFQTFRYEDLTSNPEPTITSMLHHLDLPIEPACFTPEKADRSILTPSVFQVRQPIHQGSQARWKNYEPWLGEFAELLQETE